MSEYTPTTDEMLDGYVTMRRREIPGDRVLASVQALGEAERWLAAHDAEKRAEWEAEQGETEWEYGTRCPMPECTEPHLLDAMDDPPQPEESRWRRMKAREVPAGPWMPVPDTGAES